MAVVMPATLKRIQALGQGLGRWSGFRPEDVGRRHDAERTAERQQSISPLQLFWSHPDSARGCWWSRR